MKSFRMVMTILLVCMLCLTGCTTAATEDHLSDEQGDSGKQENSDVQGNTEESVPVDFNELLDEQGYYAEVSFLSEDYGKISTLQFAGAGEIVEETEEYYLVKMSVYQPLKVPAEIQEGEKISLVINAKTGEEQGWTCIANKDGFVEFESKGNPNYYGLGEPDEFGMVPFYVDSHDAICCYLDDYEVPVLKTAQEEIVIAEDSHDVTAEILEHGVWTHVAFDDNGYVTRLFFAGD